MKIQHLAEPALEFASGGRHVDIRFGLMNHGPLDLGGRDAARRIRLGIIGTANSVEGLLAWLSRCQMEIPAKESRYPNLFPRFPGFRTDSGFCAEVNCETRMQRKIPVRDFVKLSGQSDYNQMLKEASELFVAEAQYLVQETGVEVIICAIPTELVQLIDREDESPDSAAGQVEIEKWQFHDVLKAKGMVVGRPIQMIRPSTYGAGKSKKAKANKPARRTTQDEATRAWNFHTALYYKAKGIPWRLKRLPSDVTACHVGVSFFRTLDRASVHTSVAQVFNQRGQGIIVRGPTAQISKEDRTPHLSESDAYQLLLNALKTYRREHSTYPARMVMHKASSYDAAERTDFRAAVAERGIEYADLLTIRESFTRLFRDNYYPPLRGTLLSLEERTHVLYTATDASKRPFPSGEGSQAAATMTSTCDARLPVSGGCR